MRTSTMSAREFNQHVSRAKRAAKDGPVIITERGKPAYVLLKHEQFQRDIEKQRKPASLWEALQHPPAADIDIDFPQMPVEFKPADLT
jgi:prevent-host-death family protein